MFPRLVTFPLASIGRSLLLAILIASAALAVALPGTVAAEDNASGPAESDRAQMADDCAGTGGTYFESGAHHYGCVHEDSTTTCDDRAADGDCINVADPTQQEDSQPGHAPGQDQFIEAINEYPVFDLNPGGIQPNEINIDEPGNAAPNVAAP